MKPKAMHGGKRHSSIIIKTVYAHDKLYLGVAKEKTVHLGEAISQEEM